jgi:hypothetical protein
MYRVVLHPSAEKELEQATFYYESCSEGLGDDFLEGYIHCLSFIEKSPLRWRKIHRENRKRNFDRFPYTIIYSSANSVITVIAVMHLHRRPFYWKTRYNK